MARKTEKAQLIRSETDECLEGIYDVLGSIYALVHVEPELESEFTRERVLDEVAELYERIRELCPTLGRKFEGE